MVFVNKFLLCSWKLPSQHYSVVWLCAILYLNFDMGLHYLTFMRRQLESRKKLTLVRTMNNASVNGKNIMNNVDNLSDSSIILFL